VTGTRSGDQPSTGVAWGNWLVNKVSGYLGSKTSRRGFVIRSALAGSAVAVAGVRYTTRQGSAFARITECAPGALCLDGYTEFCCVTHGSNACPPGTIAAGWWRADFSVFCNGTRYYLDCNEVCCGPPRSPGFCNACHECGCAGDCNTRRTYCNYFRYGQCNQQVDQIGPIACRMVTCTPPWTLALGCTPDGAVDNATANHNAPCNSTAPATREAKSMFFLRSPSGVRLMMGPIFTGVSSAQYQSLRAQGVPELDVSNQGQDGENIANLLAAWSHRQLNPETP